MNFFTKLVSDANGNISSSRFLNVLIGICSCLLMAKLVIMGQMTDTALALWLGYGAGTASFGKFVEHRYKDKAPETK